MTEPYVRDDVRAVLTAMAGAAMPPLGSLDASATRAMFAATRGATDLDVGELSVIRDFDAPGPAGEIGLRLFDARAERAQGPMIVYYHGGGWVIGDLDSEAPWCAEMARATDLPVVSVNYRLAPEAPFPAAPEDCLAATRWIADNGAAIGREASGLILVGDSAGANLAIITALALRDEAAAVPVIAQALLYPVVEATSGHGSESDFAEGYVLTMEGMRWFERHYAVSADDDARAYPLTVSQSGMPPTLVMTASLDPLRDQGRRYAAACAEAGVETHYLEARGTVHGFASIRRVAPSGQADLARFAAMVRLLAGGQA